MRKVYYYILIIICFSNFAYSQQISIDNSVPIQQLVEDNLVEGCVELSNITSAVNGSVNGFSSYAYFDRASSNFPFENGIMISTGNANSGGNTSNTAILNEGDTNWGTDSDLESALGISNTLNATSVEFDFISISNQIQFNYILASEEYFNNFPCNYSDGFAFLIKETASAAPYQNIALIPGTSIPVNTNTIHDEIVGFCPASNEQYFDGYNVGDTNYNGRTQVLTASASITPYVQYHVKLIIADQTDQNYDSAVFIEGNSFNSIVDLGNNITTCADDVTLNGDIQNNQATYAWYLNNSIINGQTSPTLNVTQSGTYMVEITIPLNSSTCVIQDEIDINLSSEQTGTPLNDYEICDDPSEDGIEMFDLTTMDAEVIASVPPANYNYSYHLNDNDAQNNSNAIINPIQNSSNPQTIHVRIEDLDSGCMAYSTFNIVVNELPNLTTPTPLELCDDIDPDGITEFDLSIKDSEITGGQSNMLVTYHYTQMDADNGLNPIPLPYNNINPTDQVFVRVVNALTGCINTTTLDVTILENPVINTDSHYIDACDQDHDGYATFDLTEVINDVLQGLTNVSTSFHLTQEDAEIGTNPIANITNYQNSDSEEQTLYIRVEDDVTGCSSVTPIEIHSNLLLTGTQVQDFSFCDDQNNDGIEDFDLGVIANVIAYDLPNITVTFYESQSDLDNNTNALDQNNPFSVNLSHTLYVLIGNGNCSEEAEITLYVNPSPPTGPIGPTTYCDSDDDTFATIDLTALDDHVTNGNSNFSVRYFASQIDAETGVNQLPLFYDNVSNPQTFFVRIEDVSTGCNSINSFELNILPAPSITQPSNVIICDDDQDGFSIVNLNSKIPEIVVSTSGLNIDFFTTIEDADANINVISNPNAFSATTQTIYTRVENGSTGCYNIATFNITVNTLPDFPTINNYQVCENDGDNIADFYFVNKDAEILNGQTGKEVLYFENATDATNNVNSIDKFIAYQNTSNPQTIYVRVHNITDINCFGTSSFTIQVAPNPIYNEPTGWLVCDDITNDGIYEFDLTTKIDEITQGSPDDLDITFHLSYSDAELGLNPQPLQFTNTNNPQQIFVRIDNASYCTVITEFGINIIPSPEVSESVPLEICDTNYDGIVTFNLTDSEFDILDVRQDDIVITYFETQEDLDAELNVISNPNNYTNLTNPQTIFIRVTNTASLCYQSIPVDLIVNLPPSINTIATVEICENTSNSYDLTLINDLIIEDTNSVNISYHNTLSDAENNLNPIIGEFNYTSSSTTLYIRIEDIDTGCYITETFELIINSKPFVANPAPAMEACDDDYDGMFIFDLDVNTPIILAGQNLSEFTLTHYSTFEDAESGTNMINSIYNAYNSEIIFVRVENNGTGCYYVTQFDIVIHELPVLDLNDIIAICLDDLPLIVNASTNNANDIYLWSTGETTPSIELYPEDIGNYWVTITTPFGCEVTTNFEVITSEIATINFTTTVDFADPNSITVNASGNGEYIYSLDNGPWQSSSFFDDVSLGIHLVTVRDVHGCNDVYTEVLVIDVPEFVTPNNDGYFDTWHVVGIEQLPGTIVYIFDRYGKLIKTLTHNSLGWDGSYRGEPMPTDDYWFLAEVKQNGESFDFRGHFTLKR